ncbi:MAG: molybdenum cofactor guanylyltransferase [Phycisphaerales bacterium]|jgi:molybdopterin-guanine dinucleotide biosynthesis protein A|nr:molybdenum cofactor guanylyltransferase [Phycisphaerales bacterium]
MNTGLTAAVLMGGQSRRMGHPKHAVALRNGRTMLDTVAEVAAKVADDVVLLGPPVDGYRSIADHRPGEGPVAGIESLLRSHCSTRCLILACDMPRLTPEGLAPILIPHITPVVVFSTPGSDTISPLPMVIRRDAAEAVTEYLDAGGRSIRGLLEQVPHSAIPLDPERADQIQSVNTPGDLSSL